MVVMVVSMKVIYETKLEGKTFLWRKNRVVAMKRVKKQAEHFKSQLR